MTLVRVVNYPYSTGPLVSTAGKNALFSVHVSGSEHHGKARLANAGLPERTSEDFVSFFFKKKLPLQAPHHTNIIGTKIKVFIMILVHPVVEN